MDEPFKKFDGGKPRVGLLPPAATLEVAKVLSYGAQKYSPNNWRKCSETWRYVDASLRHIFAYLGGEKDDPESGLPHLAHAACSLLFLLDLEIRPAEAPDEV